MQRLLNISTLSNYLRTLTDYRVGFAFPTKSVPDVFTHSGGTYYGW